MRGPFAKTTPLPVAETATTIRLNDLKAVWEKMPSHPPSLTESDWEWIRTEARKRAAPDDYDDPERDW